MADDIAALAAAVKQRLAERTAYLDQLTSELDAREQALREREERFRAASDGLREYGEGLKKREGELKGREGVVAQDEAILRFIYDRVPPQKGETPQQYSLRVVEALRLDSPYLNPPGPEDYGSDEGAGQKTGATPATPAETPASPPARPPTGLELGESPAAAGEVAHGAAGSAKKESEMPEGFVQGGVDTGMVYGPTGVDEKEVYRDAISRLSAALKNAGVKLPNPRKSEKQRAYFARIAAVLEKQDSAALEKFGDDITIIGVENEDYLNTLKEDPEIKDFVGSFEDKDGVTIYMPSILFNMRNKKWSFQTQA